MKNRQYVTPQILVVELQLVDLLCASGELDDDDIGWTIVV